MAKKLKSVLVIDDDKFSVILIERLLKKGEFAETILTASNGEDGLEKVKECASQNALPDLIFLDVNMPVMSGIEFLQSVKKLDLNPVPFKIYMMLTTHLPEMYQQKVKGDLVTGFIDKPLKEENLREIVEMY